MCDNFTEIERVFSEEITDSADQISSRRAFQCFECLTVNDNMKKASIFGFVRAPSLQHWVMVLMENVVFALENISNFTQKRSQHMRFPL